MMIYSRLLIKPINVNKETVHSSNFSLEELVTEKK